MAATHTRGPRRKRKSRSAGEPAPPPPPEPLTSSPAASAAHGERPQPPWYPLPLSELLILAGAIGAAVGFSRGAVAGHLVLAGVAAVALGTIEVTLREHRAGFRSHTLLLSLLPVVVLHTTVVLVVSSVTTAPRQLTPGLLVVDALLFLVLFKLLRASYANARARAAARR